MAKLIQLETGIFVAAQLAKPTSLKSPRGFLGGEHRPTAKRRINCQMIGPRLPRFAKGCSTAISPLRT